MASFSRRNDEPTRRAPNATSRPVAEGEREYGRIVTLKESFGFIRCGARLEIGGGARSRGGPPREAQVFFHASEFHRELPNRDKPALDPGDLVKFIVAPSPKGDGQMNAFDVQKCDASELQVRVEREGVLGVVSRTLRGKMKRDAYGGKIKYDGTNVAEDTDAALETEAKESDEGSANAPDESDVDVDSMKDELDFSGADLADACRLSKLKQCTKVKFTLSFDPYSRAMRATDVCEAFPQAKEQGDRTGVDGDDWNREKVAVEEEFGVISVIKSGYGFIKCCSRAKDLFFHFSELNEDASTARTGQEVQFRVITEPRTGKIVASGVRFAPKGSAVFETIDERPVRGICRAKLLFSTKGFPSRDGERSVPKGMVEETTGRDERKQYGFDRHGLLDARQNPREGELVQFCVRTDKRTQVESACKVQIMRFTGKVTSIKSDGLYGFVEHVDQGTGESGKAFVHGAEIEGQSRLNVGDELEYSLQVGRKDEEFAAKRVKVVVAAPVDPNAPVSRPESPRMNRDNQFSGSQFKITKGPDGTRGFSMGRGNGLAEKAAAMLSTLTTSAEAFVPLGPSNTSSKASLVDADAVEIDERAVQDA